VRLLGLPCACAPRLSSLFHVDHAGLQAAGRGRWGHAGEGQRECGPFRPVRATAPPGPTRADHAAGATEEGRGAGLLQVRSPDVFVVMAVVVVAAAAMQEPCGLVNVLRPVARGMSCAHFSV